MSDTYTPHGKAFRPVASRKITAMSELLSAAHLSKLEELAKKCEIPLDKTEGAVHKVSYWNESGTIAEELSPESAAFLIAAPGIVVRLLGDIAQYKTMIVGADKTMAETSELNIVFSKEVGELKEQLRLANEQLAHSGNHSNAELSSAIAKNRVEIDRAIEELRICFKSNTKHIKEIQERLSGMPD